MAERPQPLKVQYNNLPSTLQSEVKFCCWRYEQGKGDKWTKVPYNPATGRRSSSTDPETFTDYETAVQKIGSYDGIGIGIFDNIAAIDIDHCISDSGELSEAAADIVQIMQSYTEKSPSGRGLRIIFKLPKGFIYEEKKYYKKHPCSGIEVYIPGHTARYVTITGAEIESRPIEERSAQVLKVLEKYMQRGEGPVATAVADRKKQGMDRETARQEIRRSWRQILQTMTGPAKVKVNGETSYICPLCNNGTGEDGDGITYNPKSADGNGLKCFKCGFSGDIIDLYQQVTGTDYNTAFYLLADQIGITVDPYRPADPANSDSGKNAAESLQNNLKEHGSINIPPAEKNALESKIEGINGDADYTAYYRQCRQRLNDPAAVDYLTGRGISIETAAAYWIGYDPQADPANAPGGIGEISHPAPRIIIPTTTGHYIGRAIDPDTAPQYIKMNPKGSTPGIFNRRVLYTEKAQEVFVTEGAFDALAILEVGAAAIALNSTANAETLIKQLQERRTDATLIICLDNDDAGKKAAETLKKGLQQLSIGFITADICGRHKDPNAYLQADKDGFYSAVQEAQRQTAAKPDNVSYYIDALMSDEIKAFKSDIKTGYENLDQLSGGLYAGLYVVAAISSLGKTTFVHQMGDQMAAAGADVLYFSLEQSRLEMVSKSIARITAQHDLKTAVTSLSIRKGYLPQNVLQAAKEYQKTAGDRVSIIEGNFTCSLSFIGDYIRRYISKNNIRPVVIVDYLQILQPEEIGGRPQSTKEIVDSTVTELKRMSREYGITIIAICSVNRANYLTPIDFESLKESGNIEFTADVIWGLQLHCLEADPVFNDANKIKEKREKIKDEKAKNPRNIDLVCLKNRYGIANYSCSFEYYPANDLFKPVSDFTKNEMPKKAGRRIGG